MNQYGCWTVALNAAKQVDWEIHRNREKKEVKSKSKTCIISRSAEVAQKKTV